MTTDDTLCRRLLHCADYIVQHGATVREAARHFGLGKSTIYTDMTQRLARLDPERHRAVCAVLCLHRNTRHLRGGAATRAKYRALAAKRKSMGRPNGA